MLCIADPVEQKPLAADDWLLGAFDGRNILAFGPKGTGKDLLFSHVIALRNEHHYSLVPYNKKTEVIKVEDLNLGENNFKDMVKGVYHKIEPRFNQGEDVFLPELGMFLPCQYNGTLNELYPSFPIFYAGSRHYYEMSIHGNSQALSRPWDKIREQADGYIRTLGVVHEYDVLKIHLIYYARYNDASNMVLPIKDTLENGSVSGHIITVPKREVKYDSKYLRSFFFDVQVKSYPCRRYKII